MLMITLHSFLFSHYHIWKRKKNDERKRFFCTGCDFALKVEGWLSNLIQPVWGKWSWWQQYPVVSGGGDGGSGGKLLPWGAEQSSWLEGFCGVRREGCWEGVLVVFVALQDVYFDLPCHFSVLGSVLQWCKGGLS